MCGITGFIGYENAKEKVQSSLDSMKNRGNDHTSIIECNKDNLTSSFGHNLHSIVGYVQQPFEDENFIFAINGEIYNWKELSEKYNYSCSNDSELVYNLCRADTQRTFAFLDELDGVYAFFLFDKKKNSIYLTRDLVGVKPLFYCKDRKKHFAFSSEKKTLLKEGCRIVKEVNPRNVLSYNYDNDKLEFATKTFFSLKEEWDIPQKELVEKLEQKLIDAIVKRIPDKRIPLGILFSGGIDSAFIAYVCKKYNIPCTCYTAAVEGIGDDAPDLLAAKSFAEKYDMPLKIATVALEDLEKYIKIICPLIESNNVVKVGVALPFYLACESAKKDGVKVILSGLGSEEIFAGYERHAVSAGIGKHGYNDLSSYENYAFQNVNKECLSGLMQIHERDLYRDDVITMFHSIELRLPFLDKDLIDFSLQIPPKFKISKEEKKIILREVAEKIGISEEFSRRPKKAAQYGSKFDKAIMKLAKKKGFARKSSYLQQFYKDANLRLGSLLSTGKDSIYATYIMMQQNYEISCFLTMESTNADSYMFHTPSISLATYQAKAAGIPLIIQKTKGDKEEELDDLELLLKNAKETYDIDGVVTGAIFSTYQRDRIEKICDKLGLICRNPLWHKDQKEYMYELLENKIEFVFSKVMAEGLDKKWVGKIISKEDVNNLVELNKKIGINIAGEGGEFETLVLDCPFFKKKISLENVEIKQDPEREETATLHIKKLSLQEK